MIEHEKLVEYYEQHLKKVKELWGNGKTDLMMDRGKRYIKYAEEQLEEVRNGRNW